MKTSNDAITEHQIQQLVLEVCLIASAIFWLFKVFLTLGGCTRVTVVLCVCVCVCYHSNWCIVKVGLSVVVSTSAKVLYSKVLVTFADHHCLPWPALNGRKASFQMCRPSNSFYNSTDSSLVIVNYQQRFMACEIILCVANLQLLIRHTCIHAYMHGHATYYVIVCNCIISTHFTVM